MKASYCCLAQAKLFATAPPGPPFLHSKREIAALVCQSCVAAAMECTRHCKHFFPILLQRRVPFCSSVHIDARSSPESVYSSPVLPVCMTVCRHGISQGVRCLCIAPSACLCSQAWKYQQRALQLGKQLKDWSIQSEAQGGAFASSATTC